jgi:hypothetical protein
MLTTKAALDLRIKHNLGARVTGVFYDDKKAVHRVSVTIGTGGEKGRVESHNFYVHSDSEVFSQEAAVALATGNYLGMSHHSIIKKVGNNAPEQENSSGNNEESGEESNEETSSEGEGQGTVGKASKGRGKGSSGKGKSGAGVKEEPAEEMEKVESPYKEDKEEKKTAAKAPKLTTYNREDERHVDILSNFLTEITGSDEWQSHPNITQFSISLVGKSFIDEEGEIVESFSDDCKKFFKLGAKKRAL